MNQKNETHSDKSIEKIDSWEENVIKRPANVYNNEKIGGNGQGEGFETTLGGWRVKWVKIKKKECKDDDNREKTNGKMNNSQKKSKLNDQKQDNGQSNDERTNKKICCFLN